MAPGSYQLISAAFAADTWGFPSDPFVGDTHTAVDRSVWVFKPAGYWALQLEVVA